ncbi:hypothetical protein BT63DRAFT_452666 [Microthyrium microscopicum]|uniref:Uncharacterized protein n=1 Tax=Microthyrium microscopicum TaxID=703497 RepID=A0A6A6UKW6_9PEZI|nr:hypothetical protein BT63DRAFT_452666 [Microthyrium microscopicum]
MSAEQVDEELLLLTLAPLRRARRANQRSGYRSLMTGQSAIQFHLAPMSFVIELFQMKEVEERTVIALTVLRIMGTKESNATAILLAVSATPVANGQLPPPPPGPLVTHDLPEGQWVAGRATRLDDRTESRDRRNRAQADEPGIVAKMISTLTRKPRPPTPVYGGRLPPPPPGPLVTHDLPEGRCNQRGEYRSLMTGQSAIRNGSSSSSQGQQPSLRSSSSREQLSSQRPSPSRRPVAGRATRLDDRTESRDRRDRAQANEPGLVAKMISTLTRKPLLVCESFIPTA